MSLARAVSCTPGSWTTTRSAALLLDDRLGDAELVDPVAQDRDVLQDRAVLNPLLRLGLQARDEPRFASGGFLLAHGEVGKCVGDLVPRARPLGVIA